MTRDERSWLNRVFSGEELRELIGKTDRILWDQENGLLVQVPMSNNQCMELVHHYRMVHSDVPEAFESYEFLDEFLSAFVAFVENHLDSEIPNWNELFVAYRDDSFPDEDD